MGKQYKKKYYKKKKAKAETTSSVIPIDKLKFAIGDNQGENIERLKKELIKTVQSELGAKMAQLLLTEQECDLSKDMPRMALGAMLVDKDSSDETRSMKEQEDRKTSADHNAKKRPFDNIGFV